MNSYIHNCMKIIVFTDLDGTLLDEDGSLTTALPVLSSARVKHIPVIFVTSKTCAEVEIIQKRLDMWGTVPFVIENGGAVYIPAGYFRPSILKRAHAPETSYGGMFWKIPFGSPYEDVRRVMHEAAETTGYKVQGIGDMSVAKFADYTGLPYELAMRGKRREYQEGYLILIDKGHLPEAQHAMDAEIRKRGYDSTIGGGFCHIMKGGTKEKAVQILIDLYRIAYREVVTIGFGDAQSDVGFLSVCDEGYLVSNPSRLIDIQTVPESVTRLAENGPRAVQAVLHEKIAHL